MKKIYLIFSLLLISSIFASAQMIVNISGQVTDISTNAPVPNQAVYIHSDSVWVPVGGTIWIYSNIVYTNANGYYSDVVTIPVNLQLMFYISTVDCNSQLQTALGVSTNSPIVANFSICTTVTSQCSASFIAYPDSVNPLKFFFMDQSIGNPTNWLWDFGDNTTSTSQNPTHTYSQAGVYVVCLTISGGPSIGCLSSTCDTINTSNTLPPNCLNNFNYTANNLAVSFTSTAIGTAPISYSWNFGDNTTGTSQNPTHTYLLSGTYTVTLTTTDATNCVFTSTKFVYLNNSSNCQAMFYAVPDSTNPLTMLFVDVSTGNPNSWIWDFGDGTSGTGQYPSHTYLQTGVYIVCLTISNNTSLCQSTTCDTINTSNTLPPNCLNNFNYTANNLAVSFTSTAIGTAPISYSWNFGDNTTSTLQNPTHTYLLSGTYTVTLTTTDATNCVFTSTKFVYLNNNSNCQAMFYAVPDSTNPLTIHFMDISLGSPTNWNWDFGDNTTGTSQNPTHTYSQTGVYVVCLTISGGPAIGCQSSICDSIAVPMPPPSGCQTIFTYTVTATNTVAFSASCNLPNANYMWNFGDGTTGAGQNITHTYLQAGTYYVCVTASGFGIICTPYCQNVSLNTLPPNTGYVIGSIMAGNNHADLGDVYLIEFDPILNTLTAIDTTAIDSGGYYGFGNVQYGGYLVKAALSVNSVYYQNYLPTYYGDVLYWAQASFVSLNNVSSMANINLIAGNNPGGPGFIGGNVTQGANKLITPGSPIENVQILLIDASNTPVLVSYSDVNGDYALNNLAYGTYLVYAEVVGKTTYPIEVAIDANTPSVTGINIVINSNSVVASIEQPAKGFISNIGEVYPNPNNGEAFINISTLKSTDIKFSIYNQIGEIVLQWDEYVHTGNNKISFNTNELQEGFYYIQISTKAKTRTLRKFVKLN